MVLMLRRLSNPALWGPTPFIYWIGDSERSLSIRICLLRHPEHYSDSLADSLADSLVDSSAGSSCDSSPASFLTPPCSMESASSFLIFEYSVSLTISISHPVSF